MGNCLESCSVALRIEAPNVISFKLFKACEEGNVEAVLKLLHPPKEPTEQDLKEQNITDPKEWKRPHPAKADVSDRDGAQPIHIAAQNGFGKVIEILVEHGADPQARDNTGWCPAHSACMYGHVDALKVILEKTNGFAINTRTDDGVSLLHVLAQQGNLTFTKFLCYVDLEFTNLQLLPKDIWGYYPFHYAAENKHPRLLQFLLEHLETNTDYSAKELVNYNTAGGATCIHFACANGDDETLKLLLKYGAYPDAKGANGIEPIHLCAEKGHISTMKILLGTLSDEEKAAIDERRKADKISKKSTNNSKQVSQNNTGRASGSNSLSATPKNNTSNQESSAQTPNVEKPIVATEEEQEGNNIVPTSNNDEEDQKQEEEQEKKDEELRRIEEHFHSAAQHLFPKNEEYIDRRPHHTSLTTRTRQGYTVLMYAVAAKQVEMIKFLVNEMKVCLTTKCVAETTALDFAKQRKLREVIELLGGNLEEYDKEEEDRLLRRQLREQLQREKEEQERKEKEEGGGENNNNNNSGAAVTASSSATTALHQDERQKDQENHDVLPGEEQPSTMSCDSGVETVAGAVRSTHPADNDDEEEEDNQKNDRGNRNDNDDNDDVDVPVVKNDDSTNEPIAE